MKKILTIWEKKNKAIYNSFIVLLDEIAKDLCIEIEYFTLQEQNISGQFAEIRALKTDYLLVFDMAGFQQSTLQEVPSYNIMTQKQIHFLFDNDKKYQSYLFYPLALNLFFVESNWDLYIKYKREYPHLLNMEYIKGINLERHPSEMQMDVNKMRMKSAIYRVLCEVENASFFKASLQQKTWSQFWKDN